MPLEPLKDANTFLPALWEGIKWFFGILGVAATGVWGHINGRIRTLETNIVTAQRLEKHIEEEEKQFDLLFKKHDEVLEKLSAIAVDVAMIKGKLSANHDWQDKK